MSWEQVRALAEKGMIIGHYGCNGHAFQSVPREAVGYAIGRIQIDDDDLNTFLTKISRTYLL